jgi:hypothetical protein
VVSNGIFWPLRRPDGKSLALLTVDQEIAPAQGSIDPGDEGVLFGAGDLRPLLILEEVANAKVRVTHTVILP